ncbi:MAG: DNA repair protein RecN, partial [Xanthomonadales bacterium]|nr:DNA repair protein RecN [Xanthomonadales bacterium]
GIGGDTARVVGRLLARLAERGQSLCVTHLAQVAVCAGTQFRVSKLAGDSSTRVDVTHLGGAQRVDEVARMLGGEVTEQSRAHAAELLAAAGQKVA